jgi:subtilisin family serine protease
MPQVKFGKKTEPTTTFRKSDDLIAVRTRSARSLMAGPVMPAAAAGLNDGELVLTFPEAGVEVYRVPTEGPRRSLEERKTTLRRSPDVRFAGGVLVDDQSGEPVVYTENLFIKFVDQADPEDCRAVLQAKGLAIKEEVKYATNAFFVAVPEGTGTAVFDIALELLERDDVEYCHPEVVRRRNFRAIAPTQWHLKAATINNVQINAHANVESAHAITLGAGATIAIIDDSVDIDHPEFASSGKIVAARNATTENDDPRPVFVHPRFGDNHGTACAGVACADGVAGASGVAPRAKLVPIRLVSGLGSHQEAKAFEWAADHGADIISCSWGPADGDWFDPDDAVHNQIVPIAPDTKTAIDYATTHGRGGKGCIVLFAAGNGNERVENDGYASYEKVIAVAACNDRGKRSVYSDFGAAVWCAFPSNDSAHTESGHPAPLTSGITTTDWTDRATGPRGYGAGNYTQTFGGTSSACPGAAGVAALILSVNPQLSWSEVKDILARSCDRIDPQGGQYDANGRSPLYGFGRLNALKAVELARPRPESTATVSRTFNAPLPDLQTVTVALEVGDDHLIESVVVDLDVRHTYIGDLLITLLPPPALGAGDIVLHDRKGGATKNIKRKFTVAEVTSLSKVQGKQSKGTWQLRIQDTAQADAGTLVVFGLEFKFASGEPRVTAESDGEAPRRARRVARTAATGRK